MRPLRYLGRGGYLAGLVAERLRALRGQLAALAREAADLATRSVGSAVGETVRLALRAALDRGGPPPAPSAVGWDGRARDRYGADPDDPDASHDPGRGYDPHRADPFDDDPWDEQPYRAGSAGEPRSEPTPGLDPDPPVPPPAVPNPPLRGWWGRLWAGAASLLVPARLTRSSLAAAAAAALTTLLPPALAALVAAALAAQLT